MNGWEILDMMGNLNPVYIEAAAAVTKKKSVWWKKYGTFAAALILLLTAGVGMYVYTVEAKEYNAAVQFFEDYDLPMEGLTRGNIKAVYRDITEKSFTYEKTAEVIENSLTPEQKNDYKESQGSSSSGNAQSVWEYKMHSAMWNSISHGIELSYHGNSENILTIDNPDEYTKLLNYILQAMETGTQGESTHGYYGVPYGLTVYRNGEKWLEFSLWSETQYSTSQHKDDAGYEYFYNADLTELFAYLENQYGSADFWYGYQKQRITGNRLNDNGYETAVTFANLSYASELYSKAINAAEISFGSAQSLPIYKFDSLDDYQGFRQTVYSVKEPTLDYALANCDKDYFDNHTLLLVYVPTGNRTDCYGVDYLECNGSMLRVHLQETTGEASKTDGKMGWFVLVAVADSMVEKCTAFDAKM